MSKKFLSLALVLCMLATLGLTAITASAALPESPWEALDLEAFAAGTDANWSHSNGVAVETIGDLTGVTTSSGGDTQVTNDPAFLEEGAATAPTNKRGWGWMKAAHSITSTDTSSYIIDFDHKMAQGSYKMSHAGLYVYLRTSEVGNYLDNRFAFMIRRNYLGVPQIGLKPATGGASPESSFLNIANENIDLLDCSIRVVDIFETNTIKVYATDSEGTYNIIGTVTVDPATASATLTADSGSSLTVSGYSNAISATATTPIFIFNEYPGYMNNLVVSYPYEGPKGITVSPAPGSYFYDSLEPAFSCPDEGAEIYYTVDGSDPIENIDDAYIYFDGDYIDLNPDGLDLPLEVTLKAVEVLDGEYSNVYSWTYNLVPDEMSWGINYDDVLAGTDANWKYSQSMVPTKFDEASTYNDAVTIESTNQWSHIYSQFTVPALAGSSVTKFNVKNVKAIPDDISIRGLYLSVKLDKTENMTTMTAPFIYFDATHVGLRTSTAWGNTSNARIPFGVDIDLSDGEAHAIEFRDYYDGDAYLFIDDQLVAKAVINGNVFSVTNVLGQTVSRNIDGSALYYGKDNFVTNFCILHNTATVGELEVSYPAPDTATYAQATLNAENAELIAGFESFDIEASTDAGVMYYTTDGSLPTLDSETTEGTITVPTTDEDGEITVVVRPYADGLWGIGDTVTYTVKQASTTKYYDFNDDSYLEDWGRYISAGGTTYFTPNEEGKLVPGANWSMLNTLNAVESGLTNTITFDVQDLDALPEDTADDWFPLGVGVRAKNLSTWFNEASVNTNLYVFFNQNKLGLRINNTSYNNPAGYSFIDVDADFTNETRVIFKDSIENNLIGIYVQDVAGTTDPELIAYLTLDYDSDETYVVASLYSTLGGKVENIPYPKKRVTPESFQPLFMTVSSPNYYTVDNVEITINNAESEAIDVPVGTPEFTEVETGSDYYKLVTISANAAGEKEIYYTLDGTVPSSDNGTLYEDGAVVLVSKNATLSAIAYDVTYGGESEVATQEYTLAEKEYFEYPLDPAAVVAGTDENWKQASNNQDNIPAISANEDGSFTFFSQSSKGGVGAVMTKSSLTKNTNGVVITEMDVNNWSTAKNHSTGYIGLRHGNNSGTSMTDNNMFFIKLSGTEIGIKNEGWGKTGADYLPTGVDFAVNGSTYGHLTVIDDKINNKVTVLGNNKILGTYTFSTTTKTNDTVTLTTPDGASVTRTYTVTIPNDGQVYFGMAYNPINAKNVITYSGTVVPEYDIIFNAGEFGTVEQDTYSVAKYNAITEVPEVTTDYTFEGWTNDGGKTILSAEEVAAIKPADTMTFTAVYSNISLDNYAVEISTIGTSPVFIDTFKLNGIFDGEYDVYYTFNGEEPTLENATKWDGTFIEFNTDATVKAFATDGTYTTGVATAEIDVANNEYFYAEMDNAAMAANYGDRNSTDAIAFNHSSNRGKDADGIYYAKTLTANEDGSLHIDGMNYGNSGTGVSTTYHANDRWDSSIETSETTVYSFDVKNVVDPSGTSSHVYRSIYLGVRVPSDTGYGALVNNNNPQITIRGKQIGYKFGRWGGSDSVVWAENVPENTPDTSADEWVNITVVDDRFSKVIKVFSNGILLATYEIDGADFTMIDCAGKRYTATFAEDIIADGHFYIGAAYYSFDLTNFSVTTGTVVPDFVVTFDVGENGTTSDKTVYTYSKYDTITEVPEVTANPYYTFNGWKLNDSDKVYTDLEIIKLKVNEKYNFVADYTFNPIEVSVKLDSVNAEKGRIVKVPFNVNSSVEVAGYVTFAYDDTALTFNEANSSANVIDNGDGTITINVEGLGAAETVAFTFNGEIGTQSALQVCDYDLAAVNEEPIAVAVTDAVVTATVLKGDANQNGKIDIYDAVAVLKHIAETAILEGDAFTAADVNADSTISIADATLILKYIARMIETF